MKRILFSTFIFCASYTATQCKNHHIQTIDMTQQKHSIHQFSAKTINGKTINLSDFKGKKIMIVNTASKCGLTPQFAELEKLFKTYKDKNFIILGFPSNDFMNQDPGTNQEILEFCEKNYGVSFLMMEKIIIKGKNQSPIYHFLTDKNQNLINDEEILWNFQKFLINEKGLVEKVISPKTSPLDPEIIDWIENN